MNKKRTKKAISLETFGAILFMGIFFGYLGSKMGIGNMFNTLMNTGHDLLLNTGFFIMAIAVIAGAFSSVMTEFGVVALINKLISPIMRPLYHLPGAASLAIVTTFLSDNPAVISLVRDKGFKNYFTKHELPVLCNLGTSFGMGLVVWTFMGSLGNGTEFMIPATIGVLGAFIGSVVSVRIMVYYTKKHYQVKNEKVELKAHAPAIEHRNETRTIRDGNIIQRVLEAMLDGGQSGVEMGLNIIPGVVIISSIVMILTNEPAVVDGISTFTGAAYEGVGLLPKIGEFLSPIIRPLFGFQSPKAIAFPITALGSVGAALGMVTDFLKEGVIDGNDIAVFTSLGMFLSGYLSTHVAMMDALGVRELTNKAILSHSIGGLIAGISSHYIYLFFSSGIFN
ncbi:MAG: hypothetical protein L0I79_07100 [Atopostipes sp.]|nr:hypothetical protein [Atopostipes sp.]